MNWILFGFKSCGKTTLGKRVAAALHRPFIDTDRLIEGLYYARTGLTKNFREIFNTVGSDAFRKMETDVLEQLKSTQNTIIALGGGLILDPINAALLAKLGQLVYLKVNKATLKSRMLRDKLPAYLDPLDPAGSFEKMYQERLPKYEEIFALSIDLEKKAQDKIATELCALIKQREAKGGQ
jgi:shikimate kinase